MASNTINIGVDVTSNLSEVNKAAERLRDTLKEAAKVASSINIPSGWSSQRSANQTRTFASASQQASTPRENLDYRTARGISEVTGAASRDFARQAQGLGGLVHLYATFAANLFAVSAAFTALKNAADTSNMIKGLDQLGAASGRGLGTLSKEIVKLTDGAVSLRDAMEATGKAVSSGMSNENLRRLAVGANNVSKALGVAVPDALSRLSRGISKLEPELLDELGIFVRVDKAAEDYARTLGKPTSALTDFERRTAFATATLDQLDKKFGVIKMDANPYDKLLASLKDIAQTGLEVVNKVLGPLVKVLSESPTALTAVLAAVGGKLLTMAAPTLNAMSKNRKAELDSAKLLYEEKVQLAKEAAAAALRVEAVAAENNAELQMAKTEALNKRLLASDQNSIKQRSKVFQQTYDSVFNKLASGDGKNITGADYLELDKKISSLEKSQAKGKVSAAVVQEWKDAKAALEAYVQAELKYRVENEKAQAAATRPAARGSAAQANEVSAARAAAKALSAEISANAAYEASINGIGVAWQKTKERVKEATDSGQMGKVRAGFTLLSSGVGAVTSRLSGLISAFGVYGQVAAAGLAVAGMLDSYFSKNTKELEALNNSLETVSSTTEHLTRTFSFASKLDPIAQISTDNLAAKATAIYELTQALEDMAKKARAAQEQTNLSKYDSFWNGFKDYFDASIADKAATSLTNSLSEVFAKLPDDPKAKQAAEEIAKMLNLKDLTDKSKVDNALEKTFKDTPALFEEISKKVSNIGKEMMVSAQSGVEFKKSLEDGAKKLADFTNSFIPSDKFSQLGMSIMEQSNKAKIALEQGPVQALATMRDIISDPKYLAMFPPETAKNILAQKDNIEKLSEELALSKVRVDELRKAQEELSKVNINNSGTLKARQAKEQEKQVSKAIEEQLGYQVSIETDISKLNRQFDEAITQKFIYGANIVGSRIAAEWAKVGSATTNVLLNILGDGKQAAQMRYDMEVKQLAAQSASLKMQQKMIESQFRLAEELKAATALNEIIRLEAKQTNGPLSAEDSNRLTAASDRFKSSTGNLDRIGKKMSGDEITDLLKRKEITTELVSLNQSIESLQAQQAALGDQQNAAGLVKRLAFIKDEYAQKSKLLDTDKKLVDAQIAINSIIQIPAELQSKEILLKQQSLEIESQYIDFKKQTLALDERKALLTEGINSSSGKQRYLLQQELVVLDAIEVSRTKIQQAQDSTTLSIKQGISTTQKEYDLELSLFKLRQEESQFQKDLKSEQLNTASAKLNALKNSGVIAETDATKEEFRIKREQLKLEMDQRVESIKFAKQEYAMKIDLIQKQYALIEAQSLSSKGQMEVLAAEYRQKASKDPKNASLYNKAADSADQSASLYSSQAALASSSKDSITKSSEVLLNNYDRQIEKQKELTAEKEKALSIDEKSTMAMSRLTELSRGLSTAFGDSASVFSPVLEAFSRLGSTISTYSESLSTISSQNKVLTTEQANLTTEMSKAYNTDDLAKMLEINDKRIINDEKLTKNTAELTAEQQKRDKAGVDGTMSVLSASKKLFKEKTVAHKLISGMEKAYMIWKMAMTVKEMVLDTQKTAQAVAGASAEMAADTAATGAAAANSIASAGSGDPYTGIARVIAMLALMAIPLAMVGKSSSGASAPSITSQQIRDLGSGQTYDASGNIVETGGGVFGDASAKSESIAKSLEIMKNNSVDGLVYQKQMVRSLDKMVAALTNAAESIYSVPGIRKGTSLDSSIQVGTTINQKQFDITKSDIGILNKVMFGPIGDSITKFLANTPLGSALAKGGQKLYQTLFGGKTTTTVDVQRSGIEFAGTIGQILSDVNDSIRQYRDILVTTKKSGGWFGKSSTSTSSITQTETLIGTSIGQAFKDTIAQAAYSLQMLGSVVGDDISSRLNNLDISGRIELKDLETGTDIQEYIQQRLSEILDTTASTIFPYFENYRKFGEGMFETVTRVVQTAEVFKQTMKNIGVSLDLVGETKLDKYKNLVSISDTLVDNMGGLEEFITKTQAYSDSFLSDAEKLIPIQDEVSAVMVELGKSSVDTKAEFKSLVRSIDTTTESGQDLFISLMDISDSFAKLTDNLDSIISSAGLNDFGKLITSAISDNALASTVGQSFAQKLTDGVRSAIIAAPIELINTAITENIIQPLIQAVVTGTSVTAAISSTAMAEIRSTAIKAMDSIRQLFSDADFMNQLQTLSTDLSNIMTSTTASIQIMTGSIAKINKKYVDSSSKVVSSLKSVVSNLNSAIDKFKNFASSLRDFAKSLLTNNSLTTLTPAEQYAQSKSNLLDIYNLAKTGDEDALSKLQSSVQSFLEISRSYYASSDAYTQDFSWVQDLLETAASAAESKVTEFEQQLKVAQDQLIALGQIVDNTASISDALEKAKLDAENAKKEKDQAIADTFVSGFTTLDRNVDGLLTKDELGALGLSTDQELQDVYNILDTNQDGTITAMEAIKMASEGTQFAVKDLQPYLQKIADGSISITQAISALGNLNAANTSVSGGSAISGGETTLNNETTRAQSYIAGIYKDLLNRSPDMAGLAYWTDKVVSGALTLDNVGANIAIGALQDSTDRPNVIAALKEYIKNSAITVSGYTPTTEEINYVADDIVKSKDPNNILRLKPHLATYISAHPEVYGIDYSTAASRWLAANPNFIEKYAGGGQHLGGVRIVGEQGPELEATGPARYWSANQTRNMLSKPEIDNSELIDELRKLNAKIASLEQTVQQGDIMNVAATERNTQQVAQAVSDSATINIHASKVQKRATIS